jgi:hypothetical protein
MMQNKKGEIMSPLFKTSTKYTYDEMKRCARFMNKRIDFCGGIAVVVCTIFYAVSKFIAEGSLTAGDILIRLVTMVCALAVYYVIVTIANTRSLKKEFTENKVISNADVEFEFFEDYYTIKSGDNSNKLEYSQLHKIKETETNFYLLISSKQVQIIVKDNCDEGLVKFLQSKAENK